MKRMFLRILMLMLVGMLLAACNFPMLNPANSDPGAIYTAAAETAIANATLLSQPRPTITFIYTPLPSLTPSPPPVVTAATSSPGNAGTAVPSATSGATTGSDCDSARFVRDVTVPDGTDFAPGAHFTKTWRLENTGTCTWTSGYAVVFADGDRLDAPAEQPLSNAEVAPGEEVEISVDLVAPAEPGSYQADFELQNASGQIFGLGETGDKTFWARIDVVVASGIDFDMLAQASSADWFVNDGSGEELLDFNGDPDAPEGFAGIVERVVQEDGRTSSKILATFPPEGGGELYGEFPDYVVQSGDHFLGRLGFLANPDGSCGPGEVEFRLLALDDGDTRELGSWEKTCNGRLQPVDVNLSALRGRTVQFVLEVDSQGSSDGDMAFWSSARIER